MYANMIQLCSVSGPNLRSLEETRRSTQTFSAYSSIYIQ